ncbi:MAG TPA: hypothetical protein VKD28_15815 [Gemmatimonadales bacterium]|nr:hypothetical protein [Gemmatimonadales bacterium]
MKKLLHAGLLSVVVILGSSCGDSTGSGAGELQVRLTTPNSGADSAIVLTIIGPAGSTLTKATGGTGLRLFQPPLTGNTTRFALIGRLTQGAVIMTIGVPDVNALSRYSGTIEGVAQPNYQLRTSLGGYALAITR